MSAGIQREVGHIEGVEGGILPRGRVYDGELEEGIPHGFGIRAVKPCYSSFPIVYMGEFKKGERDGYGKFTHDCDQEQRDAILIPCSIEVESMGEFEDGVLHGFGSMEEGSMEEGSKKVGEFQEGVFHGYGEQTLWDRSRTTTTKEVGEFKEGLLVYGKRTDTITGVQEGEFAQVFERVGGRVCNKFVTAADATAALAAAATAVATVTTTVAASVADAVSKAKAAALLAAAKAAAEEGTEEEEVDRQRSWNLLDKAEALREEDGMWTMRLPDGDIELPIDHTDLVGHGFPMSFIDKCTDADDFIDVPPPSDAAGITKLKVEIVGAGGRKRYWGLKNDTVVPLKPEFARKHFKSTFIEECANAKNTGKFIHVPIGDAEDRPTPSGASLGAAWELGFPSEGGFHSCGKPVKYRDVGKKGLCAPYGLASVLDGIDARDNTGADLGSYISKDAKTIAKASGKGSGGNDSDAVKACVDVMNAAGWPVDSSLQSLGRTYSATIDVSENPTLVQLTEGHCVATIKDEDGAWVVDANEENWLPLSHKTLSRCMGAGRRYKSGCAIRAYQFSPGKKARKFTKRARGAACEPASKKPKA